MSREWARNWQTYWQPLNTWNIKFIDPDFTALPTTGNWVQGCDIVQIPTNPNGSTEYRCVLSGPGGTAKQWRPLISTPPSVTLTGPSSGTYQLGSNLTLTATATAVDGTIASVAFYSNTGQLLANGVLTNGVYTYVWSNVPAGSYQITACAYDSHAAHTMSSATAVSVQGSNPGMIQWTNNGIWAAPTTQPGDLTVSNLLMDGAAISSFDSEGDQSTNDWLTGHNFTFNLTVPSGQTVTLNSWTLIDYNLWSQIEPQCTLNITGGTNASLGAGNFTQGSSNGTYSNYSMTVTPTPVVLNPGNYTFTLNAADPNCGGNGGWAGWNQYTINLNEGGGGSTCATPTFTPVAGTYGSAQSVTISTTTGGATIRYTTNGTTPSSTVGTVYSSAVSITANCHAAGHRL